MNSHRHFLGKRVAIATVFLAAIVLVACQQSQQTSSPPPGAPRAAIASEEKVYVVFEGPWAFATDPKNANMVLALAPKTSGHRDLNVAASNNSNLSAGIYDLSVPTPGGATTAPVDATFAQAKIDANSLQHAIDDKSGRYVIRVPKPEAYVADARYRSRVGPTYPPDVSTEQNYVTAVSLRYSTSSLSGFSLSGTPDTGTFNPLLLQVDTPTVRFAIEPAQMDDPLDPCETHSRQGFRDLVKYLNITLFVDFPDNPADCHNKDPQNARPAKAERSTSPLDLVAAVWGGDLFRVHTANVDRRDIRPNRIADYLSAVMYLFHASGTDCRAPILILGP